MTPANKIPVEDYFPWYNGTAKIKQDASERPGYPCNDPECYYCLTMFGISLEPLPTVRRGQRKKTVRPYRPYLKWEDTVIIKGIANGVSYHKLSRSLKRQQASVFKRYKRLVAKGLII